ncbi:hypothetical protein DFS33DRAFT_1277680 [Desarmillaria ectypa]|nr:hypothetical protein DFS33DRAFT_1277680 [Desarmillaria ectypa]
MIPLFFSALFFTAATTSPLGAQSTCHPNFEGAILTVSAYSGVSYGTLSWETNPAVGSPVVASTSPSRFLFQQNGDYDPAYTIKTVDNLFAIERNGGGLVVNNVDWNQKWTVECTTCATNISQQKGVVASGCTIASADPITDGFCVRESRPGRQVDLAICPGPGNGNIVFSVSS